MISAVLSSVLPVSIHTPTQGVTSSFLSFKKGYLRFNPHTHAGCDPLSPSLYRLYRVSIHTPTQGVTSKWNNIVIPVCKFQSTHPRRVWLFLEAKKGSWQEFQSTHPRRVWRPFNTHTGVQVSFNPHTHAGCDLTFTSTTISFCGFNPHTHAGCDFFTLCNLYNRSSFNPHTHAGCDPGSPSHSIFTPCFNPHTHAGCDSQYSPYRSIISVSIHTPTQGVTILRRMIFITIMFQSTHPRRVWLLIMVIRRIFWCFNPHTHAGCDPGTGYLACRIPAVSIHTPTQGVTKFVFYFFMCHNCFNPHTHAGCDGSWVFWFNKFQGFNPHTHAGCDKIMEGEVSLTDVSIHTPTQGVTSINFIGNKLTTVSIHTPTQGVTTVLLCLLFSIPGFNPHTHAGCDNQVILMFQS